MRQEIAIANMERRKGKNERDYGVRQAWLGRVPTHYGSQSTSCQFETRGGICASAPHVGRAPVLPLPGDLEAGRRGKRDRRGREVEGETKERPAERVRGRARERANGVLCKVDFFSSRLKSSPSFEEIGSLSLSLSLSLSNGRRRLNSPFVSSEISFLPSPLRSFLPSFFPAIAIANALLSPKLGPRP